MSRAARRRCCHDSKVVFTAAVAHWSHHSTFLSSTWPSSILSRAMGYYYIWHCWMWQNCNTIFNSSALTQGQCQTGSRGCSAPPLKISSTTAPALRTPCGCDTVHWNSYMKWKSCMIAIAFFATVQQCLVLIETRNSYNVNWRPLNLLTSDVRSQNQGRV